MESQKDAKAPPALDAFIPYLFDDLVELCLNDGGLPAEQGPSFAEFCALYAALTGFLSQQSRRGLIRDYAPFDPDSEMRELLGGSVSEREEAAKRVVAAFRSIALNANYRLLSREEIVASFREQSLIKLRTHVDLDEFSEMEVYVRGDDSRTATTKGLLGRKITQEVPVWRRVLMLLRFKEESELTPAQRKRRVKNSLPCQPGKIYLYQYKDVPKPDLEILFPNVKVSMTAKDRALLGVPAMAALVGTTLKLGTQIAIVAGVIIYVFFKKAILRFDPSQSASLMPAAVAFLSVVAAFGALFFKQYMSYKNKRISFLKEVSEHLFFRNTAMNQSVFDHIIEAGNAEDCKEAMLVYYHLLSSPGQRFNRSQLDDKIQQWMLQKYNTPIDFDINDPVDTLQAIVGRNNRGEKKALLTEAPDGTLSVPGLEEAKEIMDDSWDQAFVYSQIGPGEGVAAT